MEYLKYKSRSRYKKPVLQQALTLKRNDDKTLALSKLKAFASKKCSSKFLSCLIQEKHYRKRRELLLIVNSIPSFSHNISIGLVLRDVKSHHCMLTLYHVIMTCNDPVEEAF